MTTKDKAKGNEKMNPNNEEINEEINEETKETAEKTAEETDAEVPSAERKALAEAVAETDKLKKELAEKEDRYLRTLAEYDNFRKRTASEKSAIYSDTVAEVVEKFLPVLDNLERAVGVDTEGESAKAVREGVEMVLRSFRETLEKLGVSEIEAEGKTFDPTYHHAVMKEEDPEKGENEITAVFQKGYTLGGKVIRYAMVKVAN